MSEKQPYYRVEKAANQPECQCDRCQMWTIVFDDGEVTEIGTSWQGGDGQGAAEDFCDLMNMAYGTGYERGTGDAA